MKNKEIIERIDKALEQIDISLDYKTFEKNEHGVAKGMEELHKLIRELRELEKTKTYKVEIEEVLTRIVEVEATSEDEAIDRIRRQYSNEEIILDDGDFDDNTTFRLL